MVFIPEFVLKFSEKPFVLISNYIFQTLWILLTWIHVVPSVRSLNSYLSQTGQAGKLIYEGLYLNV